MNATAARISRTGDPEVIEWVTSPLEAPGPGMVQLRQTAVGVNYQDIYHRAGVFSVTLPSGLGMEAAGIVEAVGPGVAEFTVGQRVVYSGGSPGSYADRRLVPADRCIAIPDGLSDDVAAAVLMKGMTVEYLLHRCFPVQAGQSALFYAAAGGVGLIAGQWGRHLGARMIGVTSGREKCELALANGYDAVIDRKNGDIAEQVRELTGGAGVPVVYDSVGKATFDASLKSLAPRGYFVSFGNTTGGVPPVEPSALLRGGSLYFTRPTLVTYTAKREDFRASAEAVFDLVLRGVIKVTIGQRYSLKDAALAHQALASGQTTGSTILTP